MCSVRFPLTPCITNMFPVASLSHLCFASTYFFSFFIVPVRPAICSEVWNCSKQGFTVYPHSVSAGGEHIFSDCTSRAAQFLLRQSRNMNTFLVYFGELLSSDDNILMSQNGTVPLFTTSSIVLLTSFTVDSWLWVNYLMPFCVFLCSTNLSRASSSPTSSLPWSTC